MSLPEFPLLEMVLPMQAVGKAGKDVTTSVWRHLRTTGAMRTAGLSEEGDPEVSLVSGTTLLQRCMHSRSGN